MAAHQRRPSTVVGLKQHASRASTSTPWVSTWWRNASSVSFWKRLTKGLVECCLASMPRTLTPSRPQPQYFVNAPAPSERRGGWPTRGNALPLPEECRSGSEAVRQTLRRHRPLVVGTPRHVGDPQTVDDAVDHVPAVGSGRFDAFQHDLASPCTNRFVRLDAAEAGVAVTGVSETGHKQPLQGQLTPVCIVAGPCPLGFEFGTTADEGATTRPSKPWC